MQIYRLDDNLIVRLPDELIESFDLKEGDEVDLQILPKQVAETANEMRRKEAMARLRARQIQLPPDWKFDREEANAR